MKLTPGIINYGQTKCRTCNKILALKCFRRYDKEERPHISTKCINCEYGVKSVDSLLHKNKRPAWITKNAMIVAAKSVPCADCGQRFPSVCMDFDHRPEYGKSFNVSQLRDHKPETIQAEIAKCDVVCSNCHRIRTAKRGYVGCGKKPKALRIA